MDLREVMKYNTFVVVGDTLNKEKYAYKIKHELIYSDVLEYELFNASSTIFSSNSVDILALAFNPNSWGNGENVFLQDLHVTWYKLNSIIPSEVFNFLDLWPLLTKELRSLQCGHIQGTILLSNSFHLVPKNLSNIASWISLIVWLIILVATFFNWWLTTFITSLTVILLCVKFNLQRIS